MEIADKSLFAKYVVPAEYLGEGIALTPYGRRKVNIDFLPNVGVGQHVIVHYNYVVEGIDGKQFEELRVKKA